MDEKEIVKKNAEEQQEKAPVKSDPETLHTPDPQEHMEGPFSSLTRMIGDGFEDDKAGNDRKEN